MADGISHTVHKTVRWRHSSTCPSTLWAISHLHIWRKTLLAFRCMRRLWVKIHSKCPKHNARGCCTPRVLIGFASFMTCRHCMWWPTDLLIRIDDVDADLAADVAPLQTTSWCTGTFGNMMRVRVSTAWLHILYARGYSSICFKVTRVPWTYLSFVA